MIQFNKQEIGGNNVGLFSSIINGLEVVSEDILKYQEKGNQMGIDELCYEVNKKSFNIASVESLAYTSVLKDKIQLLRNTELQWYMEEYKGVGTDFAYYIMQEEYNKRNQ